MEELKKILKSPPVLKQVEYNSGRPVIVTVDTSPIAIGWAIGKDDEERNRFAIQFGASILTERQKAYSQVKRGLWEALVALKANRNYLIEANVVLKTDCLSLLGMISNYNLPNIAMLQWIAYIKSLNPILKHITSKMNPVADMLSKARYFDEEKMMTHGKSEDFTDGGYVLAIDIENVIDEVLSFKNELYGRRLKDIGLYLSTLKRQERWMDKAFKDIKHQSYGYLLRDGFLWKREKKTDELPLRVVDDSETKTQVLKEFHDAL